MLALLTAAGLLSPGGSGRPLRALHLLVRVLVALLVTLSLLRAALALATPAVAVPLALRLVALLGYTLAAHLALRPAGRASRAAPSLAPLPARPVKLIELIDIARHRIVVIVQRGEGLQCALLRDRELGSRCGAETAEGSQVDLRRLVATRLGRRRGGWRAQGSPGLIGLGAPRRLQPVRARRRAKRDGGTVPELAVLARGE
mmetsp:Transcript_22470/g.57020  ORF Transcript_22470/g.57020 Transcript_22470/m.57020 type:complete len:202 (+) Transcript_22470:373-978(+)